MTPSLIPAPSRSCWLAETLVNIAAGFILALLVQLGAFPLIGISLSVAQNGIIAAVFSAMSTLQSLLVAWLFTGIEASRERERQDRARSLERRLLSGRL